MDNNTVGSEPEHQKTQAAPPGITDLVKSEYIEVKLEKYDADQQREQLLHQAIHPPLQQLFNQTPMQLSGNSEPQTQVFYSSESTTQPYRVYEPHENSHPQLPQQTNTVQLPSGSYENSHLQPQQPNINQPPLELPENSHRSQQQPNFNQPPAGFYENSHPAPQHPINQPQPGLYENNQPSPQLLENNLPRSESASTINEALKQFSQQTQLPANNGVQTQSSQNTQLQTLLSQSNPQLVENSQLKLDEIKQEPTQSSENNELLKKKRKKRREKTPNEEGAPKKVRKKKKKPEEIESDGMTMPMQEPDGEEYPSELLNDNDEVINFDEKDLDTLLSRIEDVLPNQDTLCARTRVRKIDWKVVAFNEYSPRVCQDTWNIIQKRLRQYRVLGEVVVDAKTWINKPWKDYFRHKPPNTHPDLPRRPYSPYMVYYIERRGTIINQNPGIKMPELTQIVAIEYQGLPEDERKRLTKVAAEKRKEYNALLDQFYAKHPDIPKPDRGVPKEMKPKKHTPFNLYYESQLKNIPLGPERVGFKEACKEKWKDLSEKSKLFWIDWALELQKKQDETEGTQKDDPSSANANAGRGILKKAERQLKERMAGKPEKPPNSAYSLYSRMLLKGHELRDIDAKDRMRTIALKWKEVPDEEKERLRMQTILLVSEYKRNYNIYIQSLPPEKREEELKSIGGTKKKQKVQEEVPMTLTSPKKEVVELKEEEAPIKREKVETKDLIEAVVPVTWDDMADGERSMYIKYIEKIKHYFDTQHQTALQRSQMKQEAEDEEEESDTE